MALGIETSELQMLFDLLARRHSARAFQADPVPRYLVEAALEAAGRSPSWCNTQPWQVVVTAGEGTEAFRQTLANTAGDAEPDFPFPAQYRGRYRERRLETALQLYDSLGIARDDREAARAQAARNFDLFGAPHVAIITTDADLGVYGAVDCGLFLGAFLLALEALGIGAVPQASLAMNSRLVREHFGLDESRAVVCGVSFGWEDTHHDANNFRTPRVPLDSWLTWMDSTRPRQDSA